MPTSEKDPGSISLSIPGRISALIVLLLNLLFTPHHHGFCRRRSISSICFSKGIFSGSLFFNLILICHKERQGACPLSLHVKHLCIEIRPSITFNTVTITTWEYPPASEPPVPLSLASNRETPLSEGCVSPCQFSVIMYEESRPCHGHHLGAP